MPDAPTLTRTRIAAAAGLLGAAAVAALALGVGPAPSVLQLAGASSDDLADDVSGNCDEPEHAGDPECLGTSTSDDATTSSTDDDTNTTAAGAAPADAIRSLDAAGAGTVIYAVDGGTLRLVTATPTSGWAVEVEQAAGREIELDFRSGTRRVQVNVEMEDGQVRERVRFRDDADDTDVRTEDRVVQADNSGPGSSDDDTVDDNSNSGPGSGSDDDSVDENSDSGSDDDAADDSSDDDRSGSDHPEDD